MNNSVHDLINNS